MRPPNLTPACSRTLTKKTSVDPGSYTLQVGASSAQLARGAERPHLKGQVFREPVVSAWSGKENRGFADFKRIPTIPIDSP